MGVIAGTMLGRIWLVGLAVLVAGLAEREAGLAAGLLAAALFTVYLSTTLIVKPLEEARR
jgi:putative exporter of polyketide antibiotics